MCTHNLFKLMEPTRVSKNTSQKQFKHIRHNCSPVHHTWFLYSKKLETTSDTRKPGEWSWRVVQHAQPKEASLNFKEIKVGTIRFNKLFCFLHKSYSFNRSSTSVRGPVENHWPENKLIPNPNQSSLRWLSINSPKPWTPTKKGEELFQG